jgi:hypothetical protein
MFTSQQKKRYKDFIEIYFYVKIKTIVLLSFTSMFE